MISKQTKRRLKLILLFVIIYLIFLILFVAVKEHFKEVPEWVNPCGECPEGERCTEYANGSTLCASQSYIIIHWGDRTNRERLK